MAEPGTQRAGDDGGARRAGRPGVRIGPVVFVGGLRTDASDPWAHRKGEPRAFALLWAVYLMIASLVTIFAGRGLGQSSARQLEYAALAFLTMAGFGVAVLFPMVRLSQRTPRRAVASAWVDFMVVFAPIGIVVPSVPLLTRWPFSVGLAVTAHLGAWTLASAGALALWFALDGRRLAGAGRAERTPAGGPGGGFGALWDARRGWVMASIVLAAFGGPMAEAGSRVFVRSGLGDWALLASPLTGAWAVSASPAENLLPRVSPAEWWALVWPAWAGAAMFAAAWAAGRSGPSARAARSA